IVIAPGAPVLVGHRRLPCCGCGIGWFLFFIGFIFGALPWYIGAFILLCVRVDYREKPGLVACTIGAILVLIAVSLGVQRVKYDQWEKSGIQTSYPVGRGIARVDDF
nr:60S ribosomal protein L18a-like protein [Tanacetum cinerariifolium]